MSATAVISADRRYVRISAAPFFSTVGDVQTFNFAGAGEEVQNDDGGGEDDNQVIQPIFNRGGNGIGFQ